MTNVERKIAEVRRETVWNGWRSSVIPYRWLLVFAMCGLLCVGVTACSGDSSESAKLNAEGIDESRINRGVKPEPDAEVAVLETEFGRIVIELYPNVAPQMVARFKQLVREGVYDGTTFHRIDPSLGIIQGGDPLSKDDDPANDGTGGSSYPDVPAELSDLPFEAGTVGTARGGIDTANSQFYITVQPQPSFDERYTVFGRVLQGLDNARVIMTAPLAEETQDRPELLVRITRATLAPRTNFASGGG